MLVRLAMTRRFRARWTADIHREWTEGVLRDRRDISRDQLDRTIQLMNQAVPDCLVTGYESLIDGLDLPDSTDRHVLAAAICCGAAAIVTTNLKDFPALALSPFKMFARHPDDFIMDLADLEPQLVELAAKQQRADLTRSPVDAERFVAILERQGLPQVAAFLTDRIDLI